MLPNRVTTPALNRVSRRPANAISASNASPLSVPPVGVDGGAA